MIWLNVGGMLCSALCLILAVDLDNEALIALGIVGMVLNLLALIDAHGRSL